MKKFNEILFGLITFCVLIFGCFNSFANVNNNKKIISIAYDDSGSMKNNGQDYAYASFGLQNIIGVMNKEDILNVVKMSDVYNSNTFHIDNYELRKNEIEEVKNYLPISNTSNFQTVKTAVNFLTEQKLLHGNDKSYEYYLIVMTDGKFDNYDEKVSQYISDINNKFNDVKYRGIFIGIGDNTSDDFKKDVLNASNNYYLTTKNNNAIVEALYQTHDIIYDRNLINENEFKFDENNAILSFDAKDAVKKVIVFENNQQIPVIDIYSDNLKATEKLVFTTSKNIEPNISSYIVHASNNFSYFPKGKINIEFLDKVDLDNNNLRIMVEYENGKGGSGLGSNDDVVRNTINSQGGLPNLKNDIDGNSTGNGLNDNEGFNNINNDKLKDGNVIDDENSVYKDKNIDYNANDDDIVKTPIKNIDNQDGVLGKSFYDSNSDNSVIIEKSSNILDSEEVDVYKENKIQAYLENNKDDIKPIETTKETTTIYDYERTTDKYVDIGPTTCGCAVNSCGNGGIGIGGCGTNGVGIGAGFNNIGPTSCGIGNSGCALNSCKGGYPNFPWTPNTPNNPLHNWINGGILPFLLSFLPIFLMLALLYGYIKKPRFDTRYHDFVVKKGNRIIDDGSMISANPTSKLLPFYAERGYGDNLFIKAHKNNDRVIIPKNYLTPDMQIDGQQINVNEDFILHEDSNLTKIVDGERLTYIYRSRPKVEKNC